VAVLQVDFFARAGLTSLADAQSFGHAGVWYL